MMRSILLFVATFFVANAAWANEHLVVPSRLIYNDKTQFYSRKHVCDFTKKYAPGKKAALVIAKTHLCDTGTQVCLKTAALIADPANHFVHDNFAVFETRFFAEGAIIGNAGEAQIREEWDKDDVNPEWFVLDVNSCEIKFRKYGYEAAQVDNKGQLVGMFQSEIRNNMIYLNFEANYRAMRSLLLASPAVSNLLGGKFKNNDEAQIQEELAYAADIRAKHPQQSLEQVSMAEMQNDKDVGLDYVPPKEPGMMGKFFRLLLGVK